MTHAKIAQTVYLLYAPFKSKYCKAKENRIINVNTDATFKLARS